MQYQRACAAIMKHTPGPWRLHTYLDSGRPNPGSIVADNPHGEGAEEVASIKWIGGGFHAEQAANARLIAAAPELLEALRGWLAIFEKPGAYVSPLVAAALRDTNAAIAKATAE